METRASRHQYGEAFIRAGHGGEIRRRMRLVRPYTFAGEYHVDSASPARVRRFQEERHAMHVFLIETRLGQGLCRMGQAFTAEQNINVSGVTNRILINTSHPDRHGVPPDYGVGHPVTFQRRNRAQPTFADLLDGHQCSLQ